jgi:hypothetical protein
MVGTRVIQYILVGKFLGWYKLNVCILNELGHCWETPFDECKWYEADFLQCQGSKLTDMNQGSTNTGSIHQLDKNSAWSYQSCYNLFSLFYKAYYVIYCSGLLLEITGYIIKKFFVFFFGRTNCLLSFDWPGPHGKWKRWGGGVNII